MKHHLISSGHGSAHQPLKNLRENQLDSMPAKACKLT